METHIIEILSGIKDPRIERCKKHLLEDIIILTVIAVICGAEGWETIEGFGKSRKDFLKTILSLPNGIPSHDTIERLFKRLDSSGFEKGFINWTHRIQNKSDGRIISIDGKSVNGSRDTASGKYAIHMVSAWCGENQLVLGQIKTEAKINEIEAIKQLIELLDLTGSTITIDAMGCQKEIAKKIIDKKADYILAVKDNQKSLHQQVQSSFGQLKPDSTNCQQEKNHGRIENRTCEVIHNMKWLENEDDWMGLKSLVKITAARTINNQTSNETRYFISSRKETATYFNIAVRNHWGIENSLHWVLDVQFNEDRTRKRKGNAAENFTIVRRIALNLLKKHPYKRLGVNNRRLMAGWDENYLKKILKI
jgi:predicted transposase YbfD/YdcC